jgi:hypothetical protein
MDTADSKIDDSVWCLVDGYGDGAPSIGPFGSYAAAAAHDPYDDQFEPRQISRAEWDAR